MKIFQVGGSVRDEILGVEANDKDWVVVGPSPEKTVSYTHLRAHETS